MGKKKIIGNCKIEDCVRELDSLGLCRLHYARFYKHGTTDLAHRRGKTKTSVIQVWRERHGYGTLPPEWLDFWQFYKDVGDKPSKDHYLRKKNPNLPYSKDNFEWIEHIKKQPGEDALSWRKRKWQQRLKNKPSLREYGWLFRELLRDTGISLEEYSKIYNEKLKNQNGLCAICDCLETGISNRNGKTLRLSLDHCHTTKKIRDLLCRKCSHALGLWEESIELISNSIKYLENYLKNPTGINYSTKNKVDYLHEKLRYSNMCEICGNPEKRKHQSGLIQRLSVDHCHTTNTIRGLVCARCNTGLGRIRDSIPFLQSMISYIKKHTTTQ